MTFILAIFALNVDVLGHLLLLYYSFLSHINHTSSPTLDLHKTLTCLSWLRSLSFISASSLLDTLPRYSRDTSTSIQEKQNTIFCVPNHLQPALTFSGTDT